MTLVNIRIDSATVIFKICLSQFSDISSTACLKASLASSTALSSSRDGSGEEVMHGMLQYWFECSQHVMQCIWNLQTVCAFLAGSEQTQV